MQERARGHTADATLGRIGQLRRGGTDLEKPFDNRHYFTPLVTLIVITVSMATDR